MRVLSGRVVGGKVVVQGMSLTEGATVTVVARECGDGRFELSPEDEAELLAAIDEADAGRVIPAADVLARLPRAE